ncbi:TPA: glutamate--tRNA ligase, partial [candidate division WWE3 bacterium]|nr:glutamate--tRNA ligase [candidate division WWE3 bacterium]
KEEIEEKLKTGVPHVIRMKVPDNEDISFDDLILGKITINTSSVDDQVLLKTDGFPTYHMAVVVDDHLMKITHI